MGIARESVRLRPQVPYYPRPSSPHSSSSNDIDVQETISTVASRKTTSPVQVPRVDHESHRPTAPTTTINSPNGTRISGPPTAQRQATIVKGLPSPGPDNDRFETSEQPVQTGPIVSRVPVPVAHGSTPTPPASAKAATVPVHLQVPRLQASDLRHSIATATSPYECRLLVDMFLARCGFEFSADMLASSLMLDKAGLDHHETCMVDILLGECSSFDPEDAIEGPAGDASIDNPTIAEPLPGELEA